MLKEHRESYTDVLIYGDFQIFILHMGNGRTVEDIFGFPYTSSSCFAAIWNCQAEAVYKWSEE